MKVAIVRSYERSPEYGNFEEPDPSVLINGATGVSGRLAIQIAKHLGARRVIATERNDASVAGLDALGADVLFPLDQPTNSLTRAFRTEIRTMALM